MTAPGVSASTGRPARRRPNPRRVLLYVVLGAFAVLFLLPAYVAVVGSLKSLREVNTTSIWSLPASFDLQAWVDALRPPLINSGGIGAGLYNSLVMTIPAVVLSSAWGSINGFVLSKWRFRGADTLFAVLLFGMFIPYQAILIPLVNLLQQLHLYDSLAGLAITHIVYGIPITTLIFRNYYASIPGDLVEAAKVDGAGIVSIYRRIILPLSVPGFVVVGIWQFTNIWNEFLFAVTLTSSPASQPVTVALQNLAGSFAALYNVQMAGAIMSALPTLAVYVLLSRYFIRGLLAGSLKG
ncbi:MAG: carbohydrate ABC transporter permease [Chloroflexi bacterium]|nr:carbohydrate ABC transporter permease [Chloroflexota bacterium]